MLALELKRFGVAVAGVTEARLIGNDSEDIGEGYHLIWSGDQRTKTNGVALVLDSRTRRCLLSYEQISDRILTAQIQHKHGKWTIIVCYAPTNQASDEVKDHFYTQLSSILAKVSPHDVLNLLGDFNGTVRDTDGVWNSVLGPVKPDCLNDNGLRLLQLCTMHDVVITNTLFQRKEVHKYTWYSNDRWTRKMLDYIIVSRRWRSSIINCRTYRSAESGNTDHRLVVSNLRLRLKAHKRDHRPPKLDLSNLTNSNTRQVHAVSISNRFDCLGQISESEEAWQLFKDGLLLSAESTIGRLKPRKKSWISQETLDIIEQRRKARLAKDMVTYRRRNGKEINSSTETERCSPKKRQVISRRPPERATHAPYTNTLGIVQMESHPL
ncbi:craniofacial development protein 2-like [Artemia franciscana]|uniref:craniofacial development protein 2-like n=1 Tax=Artemia franciscana TaxID=6661 RepID=UPI0032DBF2F6